MALVKLGGLSLLTIVAAWCAGSCASEFGALAPRWLGGRDGMVALCLIGVAALVVGGGGVLAMRGLLRPARPALTSALAAAAIILLLRPLADTHLDWRYTLCHAEGEPARAGMVELWKERVRAIPMHARVDLKDPDQPWRSWIVADVRSRCAGKPLEIQVRATQPWWSLQDDAGEARQDFDGVGLVIEVRRDGAWQHVGPEVTPLSPTKWTPHTIVCPPGTERVRLGFTAFESMSKDGVFLEEVEHSPSLGWVRFVLFARLKEWYPLTLGLLLLAFAASLVAGRLEHRAPDPGESPSTPAPSPLWLRMGVTGACVGLPLLFAWVIQPYLDVASTRVLLALSLPEAAEPWFRFGPEEDERVPLIRHSEGLWLANLPPRLHYDAEIELPVARARGALAGCGFMLYDPESGPNRPLLLAGPRFEAPAGLRTTPGPDGRLAFEPAADAPPGTVRLRHPSGVTPAPGPGSRARWLLWTWFMGSLLLGSLAWILWRAAAHRSIPMETTGDSGKRLRPLTWAAGILAVLHVAFVFSTPPGWMGDTASYLNPARTLVEEGSFGLEPNRLPGYAMICALVMKLAGPNLTPLILINSLVLLAGLVALGREAARVVSPRVVAVFVVIAGVSPVQLHYSRLLLTESIYVGVSLLTVAAAFRAMQGPPFRRGRGVLLVGCLTAFAVLIRPNGIALLALLPFLWLPDVARSWRGAPARKLLAVSRGAFPYALVALLVAAPLVLWTVRNSRRYEGLHAPSGMEKLSEVQGQIHNGTLDPRPLIRRNAYAGHVLRTHQDHGGDTAWHIARDLLEDLIAEKGPPERWDRQRAHVALIEEHFAEIARESEAASPWPTRLVKYYRAAYFNLALEKTRDFIGQPKPGVYPWRDIRECGGEDGVVPMAREEIGLRMGTYRAESSFLSEATFLLAPAWSEARCALFFLALLSAVALAAARLSWLSMPYMVYMANLMIVSLLAQNDMRYMDVLDVFLVLQVGLGLAALISGVGGLRRRRRAGDTPLREAPPLAAPPSSTT